MWRHFQKILQKLSGAFPSVSRLTQVLHTRTCGATDRANPVNRKNSGRRAYLSAAESCGDLSYVDYNKLTVSQFIINPPH